MNKTRTAAIAALALALPAGLAACGDDDGGPVTLRYAFWDDNQRPALEAMIEAFNEDHPDIEVELEQNPWEDYWAGLDSRFAAEEAPDVFWNHVSRFPTYAANGVLLPITDDIEADGVDSSVYPENLYDSWQYEDEQYGLPKDWDSIGLVYRLDALEGAGIDPATVNDLEWNPVDGGTYVEFLQKLTVDAAGNNALSPDFDAENVVQYGTAMSSNTGQTDWWNYAVQNGCSLQSEPWGDYAIDAPECVEAIQFTADLYNKWHVAVPAESTNQPNGGVPGDYVVPGQAATTLDGSWMLSFYRDGLEPGSLGRGRQPLRARRLRHRHQRPLQRDLRGHRTPRRGLGTRRSSSAPRKPRPSPPAWARCGPASPPSTRASPTTGPARASTSPASRPPPKAPPPATRSR